MHATAYLKSPGKHTTGPIAVLHGPERHLKLEALAAVVRAVLGGGSDDELNLTRLAGNTTDLATVGDELRTVSMWGDRRVVAVEDADEFVTRFRSGLEKYLEQPARKSVLVLLVKSWPKNTRLAKIVAKIGLDVECAELKGAALLGWLAERAGGKHGKQLSRDAAGVLVELAGNSLAQLDQELAKLTAYVGEQGRIEVDDVRQLVGGWRAETTWAMLDALLDGNLSIALAHLDQLLTAGEAPQLLMGGIAFKFRQLAEATERARQGIQLRAALKDAGVWGNKLDSSAAYLRRIGRPQAEQLHDLLLHVDADLKGGSRISERVQLERLLVKLSGVDR